ncbi:MAG: trimethylamine methyltransferase [Desulfitibacter sp. BRH_c19]|nr:MAG: trimethylamine methyltransferase [Desulfitibacter sp. BRH_c19]
MQKMLSEEQLEQIHKSSVDILTNTGMDFLYDPAIDYFTKAGFKVEGKRVFFTEEQITKYLATVPKEFSMYGRDGNDVVIGGDNICLAPGYGAPFVMENGKNRKASLEDFKKFAKLAGSSKYIDVTGGVLVEPNDIPVNERHMEMTYNLVKHSPKPFMGSASGKKEARDTIEIAKILFGSDFVDEKPVMVTLINSLTPLKYDDRMLAALVEYAEAGQPVITASLAMAGSTSPATLAGTLAVQNAEVLGGMVLTQVINPGTPVIYGAASSITAMRYGSLSIGAPESMMVISASAQLAKWYGVPVRGGGSLTDSKIPDNQASYESAIVMLGTAASGINFVLHAAGILQYYNAMSYDKFMIDEEVCGMVKRIKKGIEVNEETLATDLIKQIGPGGEFLTTQHTLKHHRSEYFPAVISDRAAYDVWGIERHDAIAKGKLAMQERLAADVNFLDEDVDKAIRNYMSKK